MQIWSSPTHPAPLFFWLFGLVWEKPSERRRRKQHREKVDSLPHPIWRTSLLAPKSGLAQKRPYGEAERDVIYSPLLPWKNLGLTGFGGQDRTKIGAALGWERNKWVALPLSTSLTWMGRAICRVWKYEEGYGRPRGMGATEGMASSREGKGTHKSTIGRTESKAKLPCGWVSGITMVWSRPWA